MNYSTSKMTWNARKRMFVTEISDHPFRINAMADSIRVQSHWTGKVVKFIKMRVEHDHDGDIAGWHYISVDGKILLLVIND